MCIRDRLCGCRDAHVVDAIEGQVGVALKQPLQGLDREIIGSRAPIHALFTGASERGTHPVNKDDFSHYGHHAFRV